MAAALLEFGRSWLSIACDDKAVKYISPESFDAQNYSSKALWGLQSTPALITVYVNGIPSVSRMVNAGDMLLRVYLPFLIRERARRGELEVQLPFFIKGRAGGISFQPAQRTTIGRKEA